MPGALIHTNILCGAPALIAQWGGHAPDIAQRARLPVAALEHTDLLVPASAVINFFERAALECDQRNFGLQMAAHSRLAAIVGPLWILLRSARTVGQMCEDLARNFDLYSSAASLHFKLDGADATLTWSVATGQAPAELQIDEFALALLCHEVRCHAVAGWQPAVVQFRHGPPADMRLHRTVFGPNLRFNQDRNAIGLDAATLARPIHGGQAGTRNLARAVLRRDEDWVDPGVAARVESTVRALLPFAPSAIKDVAQALGLPARTLQAHLQAQGQSFKDIKDAVRADLALKYLKHSQLSLTEIAEILGYSELSAFSRSFRRWHGKAPRDVRRPAHENPNGVNHEVALNVKSSAHNVNTRAVNRLMMNHLSTPLETTELPQAHPQETR